jgi:ribosomal protein L28
VWDIYHYLHPSSTTTTIPTTIGRRRQYNYHASTKNQDRSRRLTDPYLQHLTIMAANGRIVWVPAGTKGLRIKGWENKLKNMPEEATSNYATITVCILDGVDPGANAGAQGNATQLRHEQWCNNMHDTWNDTVADCTVKSIRMQNGQRSRHFLQRIEEIMSTKTEDDLVVFCYHGSAGGDGAGYTL